MRPTSTNDRILLFAVFAVAAALVSMISCSQLKSNVPAANVPSANVPTGAQTNLDKAGEVVDAAGDLVKAFQDFQSAMKDMSITDERALGETVMVQAYATPSFGVPVRDKDVMLYINKLANTVAQNSDRPMIPYHAAIVKMDDINAFSTPGGYIFLTSGLVELLDNEAQLALVIGHEVAHVSLKHAVEALQSGKSWQGMIKLVSAVRKAGRAFTQSDFMDDSNFGQFEEMVKDLAGNALQHAFSCDIEIDSDKYGVIYAMNAGYDPHEMLKVLEKLKAKDEAAGSTHPTAGERKAQLEAYLADLKSGKPDVMGNSYQASDFKGLVAQPAKRAFGLAELKERIRKFDAASWK